MKRIRRRSRWHAGSGGCVSWFTSRAASAMDQPLTKTISCLRQAHCAGAASLVRSALGEAHSSFNSLLGRFRAGARRRDRLMEGRVGQNRRSGEEGGTARGLRRLGDRPPRDSRPIQKKKNPEKKKKKHAGRRGE